MTKEIDLKLSQLKELEDKINSLSTEKEQIRKEVFEVLKAENLTQYKNPVATISQVEKKNIKFVKSQEEVLKEIEEQKLVKYLEVIPEHKELNKKFEKDLKDGVFQINGVEIEIKTSPMIRFN